MSSIGKFIDDNYMPLTQEQEADAASRGDCGALVCGILKFLLVIARKQCARRDEDSLEDAFSAAMLGAFKSAEKFDPSLCRFVTWASMPARNAVRNALSENGRMFSSSHSQVRPVVSCCEDSLAMATGGNSACKLEQEESVAILLEMIEPFGVKELIIRRAEGETYQDVAKDDGRTYRYLQTKVHRMRQPLVESLRGMVEFEGSPYLTGR